MSLTPTLNNPIAVLHKLAREQHRAFHAEHLIHKADHLYNFCVTALSLKDCFLWYKQIGDKQKHYDQWAEFEPLIVATEIANTSKHFKLNKISRTKSISSIKTVVQEDYIDSSGKVHTVKRNNYPNYEIKLGCGKKYNLFDFTDAVFNYWVDYMQPYDIEYKRQSEEEFFGVIET